MTAKITLLFWFMDFRPQGKTLLFLKIVYRLDLNARYLLVFPIKGEQMMISSLKAKDWQFNCKNI
jgi:hypothetical protein